MRFKTKLIFICEVCGKEFRDKDSIQEHYDKEHREVERDRTLKLLEIKTNHLTKLIDIKSSQAMTDIDFAPIGLLIDSCIKSMLKEFKDRGVLQNEIKSHILNEIIDVSWNGRRCVMEYERQLKISELELDYAVDFASLCAGVYNEDRN